MLPSLASITASSVGGKGSTIPSVAADFDLLGAIRAMQLWSSVWGLIKPFQVMPVRPGSLSLVAR
jgi:hypothetical protein